MSLRSKTVSDVDYKRSVRVNQRKSASRGLFIAVAFFDAMKHDFVVGEDSVFARRGTLPPSHPDAPRKSVLFCHILPIRDGLKRLRRIKEACATPWYFKAAAAAYAVTLRLQCSGKGSAGKGRRTPNVQDLPHFLRRICNLPVRPAGSSATSMYRSPDPLL